MNNFSPLEKQIIENIIRIDKKNGLIVLTNLLEQRFSDSSYYIDIGPHDCTIKVENTHFEEIGKLIDGQDRIRYIVQRTNKDVLSVIKLLEYLAEQRLIYVVDGEPATFIGGKISNAVYVDFTNSIAHEVQTLIRKYSGVVIISTHALEELKNREYRSEEQVRDRASTRFNRLVIGLSALAILTSASVSLYVAHGETSTKIANLPSSFQISNFPDSVRISNPADNVRVILRDEDLQKLQTITKASDTTITALIQKQSEADSQRIDSLSAELRSIQQQLEAVKAEQHKPKP